MVEKDAEKANQIWALRMAVLGLGTVAVTWLVQNALPMVVDVIS